MTGFENGLMRVGRPHAGSVHLVHPNPARTDDGPRPWCRPGFINLGKRAFPVTDSKAGPVCRACLAKQEAEKE